MKIGIPVSIQPGGKVHYITWEPNGYALTTSELREFAERAMKFYEAATDKCVSWPVMLGEFMKGEGEE